MTSLGGAGVFSLPASYQMRRITDAAALNA